MALKENSRKVFDYVKAHDGEDFTAADIAADLGLPIKSVNGIITMSFARHKDENKEIVPLMERVPAEVENEDGTHSQVKLIKMTPAGMAFDPDAKVAKAE